MHELEAVLVVSASAGSGHLRAGEALREAVVANGESRRVEHVDVLELAPRWVRAAYAGSFELMAQRAPWLWREVYTRTDGPASDTARWGPVAQRVLFRAFQKLLHADRWSACLCTHFLPCQLAGGRAGAPPMSLVITDLALHRYWVQRGVAAYYVANDEVADALRPRTNARVHVTGIPISPRFSSAPRGASARAALGLPADAPVAVVMGGGLGLGIEDAVHDALRANVPNLHVIAVCGRNEEAQHRLTSLGRITGRLHVVGYTRAIERIAAVADVIVTKPGGLTTSESLALGCPLILTNALPGHEEENARMLVAAGVALSAAVPGVSEALEMFFQSPRLRAHMAGAAAALGRPDAAYTILAFARGLAAGMAA